MAPLKYRPSPALHKKYQARSTFLIVCEGEKTELYYLKQLIDDWGLGGLKNIQIKVISKKGGPLRLVREALSKYNEKAKSGQKYDTVFCVFDRDQHDCFDAALHEIGKNKPLTAIVSNPCFELWLLLHYTPNAKSYVSMLGGKTASAQIAKELEKHNKNFTGYNHGDTKTYEKTKDNITIALKHAKQLAERQNYNAATNPYTTMHNLITDLQHYKSI